MFNTGVVMDAVMLHNASSQNVMLTAEYQESLNTGWVKNTWPFLVVESERRGGKYSRDDDDSDNDNDGDNDNDDDNDDDDYDDDDDDDDHNGLTVCQCSDSVIPVICGIFYLYLVSKLI